MSSDKPKQILSVVARGRKLKGEKMGIYFTIPLEQALKLGILQGDLIEIEIRKITRPVENEGSLNMEEAIWKEKQKLHVVQ